LWGQNSNVAIISHRLIPWNANGRITLAPSVKCHSLHKCCLLLKNKMLIIKVTGWGNILVAHALREHVHLQLCFLCFIPPTPNKNILWPQALSACVKSLLCHRLPSKRHALTILGCSMCNQIYRHIYLAEKQLLHFSEEYLSASDPDHGYVGQA
jgi:hypothetical protein